MHSLTKDGFDPAEHLSLKLGVTLAGDLLNAEKIGSDSHKDSDVVSSRYKFVWTAQFFLLKVSYE